MLTGSGRCSAASPATGAPGQSIRLTCRQSASRRLLSTLESMERDAIVQSLPDYDGNKVKTAETLGMSRATIYRKIHGYGIVTPPS
jgi:DNA-binding NtrC family response regulator